MLKGYAPDLYNIAQNQNANLRANSLRSVSNRPHDIRPPSYRASQSIRSFLSSIHDRWNELPTEIQCAATQSLFKTQLKSLLLSSYVEQTVCANPLCVDVSYPLQKCLASSAIVFDYAFLYFSSMYDNIS